MPQRSALPVADLYAALAALPVGAAVPEHIYVADYRDDGRPCWTVAERTDLDAGGVLLALEDAANRDMFDVVRVLVLAFPAKVLRTPPQLHSPDAPAALGNKLCDLTQQGRFQQRQEVDCAA